MDDTEQQIKNKKKQNIKIIMKKTLKTREKR